MEGFCRGCLLQYSEPTDLLQYTEKNRRLFVYATGLQVKRNDTFIFQLCKECYYNMKLSCKFKKQCRTSDKKLKKYLLLKEDGDDFESFIKNVSLKLPLASGNSTPAYQKNRDDDNESTCTSIRNFMSDLLEGEDMPPTEEQIIREVIEEEADVMDDSLDSHWLQENSSIRSDFDMDFGISPFATPRSVQNDEHPSRIKEVKQTESLYLTSKEIIERIDKPQIKQKFDMPLLEDLNSDIDFKDVGSVAVKIDKDDEIASVNSPELLEFNNSIPSEVEDMVTENSISSTLQFFKTELADLAEYQEMDVSEDNANFVFDNDKDSNIKVSKNENDICIIMNQGKAGKKVPSTNELDYYVNKAELKKKITSKKVLGKEYHCTIDRNLDIALKHEEYEQYPLDQLIISPAVSLRSGVSTPTIRNLLFGDKDSTFKHSTPSTQRIENILFGEKLDTKSAPKYFPQVGQCIDNLDDDDDKSDILENFIKNDNVGDKIETVFVKTEPGTKDKSDTLEKNSEEIKRDEQEDIRDDLIKSEDVLEEFLRGADDPLNLDEEIINQIIDPQEFKELTEQDVFKRPLTPPHDKYDIDKFYCKICNKTMKSVKSLKIHFARMHKYKLPNLDPHRNKAQNNKVEVCTTCGIVVKGASNYIRHMKKHNDSVDILQCDMCNQIFNSRRALLVHMRIHLGTKEKQKNFVCSICGKVSATSSHHKLHLRRHFKQYSEKCDICNKEFYRLYELKVHMRHHSGERPFVCEYCPKQFRRRDQLYQHLRRHKGKLDFKCDICQLEFVDKNYLARHYSSKTCVRKRKELSKSVKDKATIKYGKGCLDKIKLLMQSNELFKDIEPDNAEVESVPSEKDVTNCETADTTENKQELIEI